MSSGEMPGVDLYGVVLRAATEQAKRRRRAAAAEAATTPGPYGEGQAPGREVELGEDSGTYSQAPTRPP